MRAAIVLALALALGCAPGHADELGEPEPPPPVDGSMVPPGWRAPVGACELDPAAPRRLALTTTDFATGALTVVELADGSVEVDVAEGSTDAIPFAHDDALVLVHRHRIDRLDVLDARSWSLRAQLALASDGPSPNPHAVAFDARGLAHLTTFAEPTLRVLDPSLPPAEAERARIDLGPFADDDGNPEASLIVRCGDLMVVTIQRLDPGYRPVGTDHLVVIDPALGEALDLDPDTTAADALPLLGAWVRQLRRDPADVGGRTLLALSTGIERVELDSGIRRWVVPPEAMEAAGIGDPFQPQAFDLADDGSVAYLAAYDADYSQVRLYRVGLDGAAPEIPEPFAEGFDSAERTLELVGDHLWYGSRRLERPGLWRFDVSLDPPQLLDGPISTGLPPYSMVAIP
ncbi:MAG: hypothetical protein H6712_04165 [Myxococcales bacterium]|nr:hypothetical protein [Myxococcales bacterium]